MIELTKTLVDMGAWIISGLLVIIVLLALIYGRIGHVVKAVEDTTKKP